MKHAQPLRFVLQNCWFDWSSSFYEVQKWAKLLCQGSILRAVLLKWPPSPLFCDLLLQVRFAVSRNAEMIKIFPLWSFTDIKLFSWPDMFLNVFSPFAIEKKKLYRFIGPNFGFETKIRTKKKQRGSQILWKVGVLDDKNEIQTRQIFLSGWTRVNYGKWQKDDKFKWKYVKLFWRFIFSLFFASCTYLLCIVYWTMKLDQALWIHKI